MKYSLLAVAVSSLVAVGCGGVDVPTSQDHQITGVDDSADEIVESAPEANVDQAAASDGDTGEDGLAGDENANTPAAEGETDPGEEGATAGVFATNSSAECTANLNLRSGPNTSSNVLRTMPEGSIVKVINGAASNGFIKVEHNGLQGYAAYRYLQAAAGGTSGGGGGTTTGNSKRDAAISVAQSGVGFSYWWGGGKWQTSGATSSNKGKCTGSCPNCSHTGQNGADCSGYVAKIWQVPSSNTNIATNSHPYSTSDFFTGTGSGQWGNVSKSSIQKGDALVYRSGSSGHIVIYEKGDAWGQPWTYEARGCSYGIVHNVRSVGSGYKGIKRSGW